MAETPAVALRAPEPVVGTRPVAERRWSEWAGRWTGRPGDRRRAALGTLSAALVGQAALLVSGPLVARALGVEDRGHLALVLLIPLLVCQVSHLGLPNALTWALASARDSGPPVGLRRAVGVQLAVVAVLHLLLAVAVTAPTWADRPDIRLVALACAPVAPALLAHVLALAVLQGRERFGAWNLLRTLPPVLYALATAGLFVTGTGSVATIAAAWCVTNGLVAVTTVVAARRALGPAGRPSRPGPDLAMLRRYGLRDWLGSMSLLEVFRLDQLVVGLLVSPAALGLYVVGAAFANLPRFVAQSIGAVAFPAVAGEADPATARRVAWRWTGLGAAACAVAVGPLVAVSPLVVPLLFGEAFRPAVPVTQLLLAGALLNAVRRVLADGLRGLGRPGAGTVAEVATWVALLAALALLVPALGVVGAAGALVVSAATGLAVLAATALATGRRPGSSRARPSGGRPAPTGQEEPA